MIRVVDPPPVPYPSFHFNADPDPIFHLNADPDPHQSDANLRPLVYPTLQALISKLNASIVRVSQSSRLHFEPLRLLNFDFNADADPDYQNSAVPNRLPCTVYMILYYHKYKCKSQRIAKQKMRLCGLSLEF